MNERLDGMQLASIQYHYNDGLYRDTPAHSTIGALLATVIELEADRRALLAVARAAETIAHTEDVTEWGEHGIVDIRMDLYQWRVLGKVLAALPAALRQEMEREP